MNKKATFSIDDAVLERMDRTVPKREKSNFVETAITAALDKKIGLRFPGRCRVVRSGFYLYGEIFQAGHWVQVAIWTQDKEEVLKDLFAMPGVAGLDTPEEIAEFLSLLAGDFGTTPELLESEIFSDMEKLLSEH